MDIPIGSISGELKENRAVTGPAVKPRRPSLGARLLAVHAAKCGHCRLTRLLDLPPKFLCGAGCVLAIADLRARAKRRAS